MRSCVSQFVRRGLPVIPVLLRGAPPLPLFLQEFTWVNLDKGFKKTAIDRLVWGIKGEKPMKSPT
jgi:hypothetical protein